MTWENARGRLATVLGAVSITSPVAMSMAHVHETPPQALGETPCLIFEDPGGESTKFPGGTRRNGYAVEMKLVLAAERAQPGFDIVSAFREAIIAALDAEVQLSGNAIMVNQVSWDRSIIAEFGGRDFLTQDIFMNVHVDSSTTFSS